MIKKQFTLYMPNRPGALALITRLLARARINIEGISVSESTDVGLVQLVASSPVKARRVLDDSGVPYTVQDVALLPLRNTPGSLSKVVTALAKAGVNINYVYATACDGGGECNNVAVISAPDLKLVERVWKDSIAADG